MNLKSIIKAISYFIGTLLISTITFFSIFFVGLLFDSRGFIFRPFYIVYEILIILFLSFLIYQIKNPKVVAIIGVAGKIGVVLTVIAMILLINGVYLTQSLVK